MMARLNRNDGRCSRNVDDDGSDDYRGGDTFGTHGHNEVPSKVSYMSWANEWSREQAATITRIYIHCKLSLV
jgi:hypothetical protein